MAHRDIAASEHFAKLTPRFIAACNAHPHTNRQSYELLFRIATEDGLADVAAFTGEILGMMDRHAAERTMQ